MPLARRESRSALEYECAIQKSGGEAIGLGVPQMIFKPFSALVTTVLIAFSLHGFAAPTMGQAAPRTFRIALVSDPHVSVDPKYGDYVKNFEQVIDEVNVAKVDAVFLAGDLTQGGDGPAMQRFIVMAKRFGAPTRWVAGNHDIGSKPIPGKPGTVTSDRIARYEKNLGSTFYAVDIVPGLRVVGVASSLFDSALPAESAQWTLLEKELAPVATDVVTTTRTILLSHYPPFVTSADENDEYFNVNIVARRRLLGLIESSGVTAMLTGHQHRPMSTTIGRVPVIGAPAVSFGLPRGQQGVGWTLITIDDGGRATAENRYLPATPRATLPADGSLLVPALMDSAADRIHIFYYNWYGAPPLQKEFVHWQQGGHVPPDDIGSNYFPKLGPYSSGDPAVLKQHMAWIKQAGVGTLCLTWWGRESYEERLTRGVLDAAGDAGLKVNFHLEPYGGHTPAKLADDVRYILQTYGKHPAFYRAASQGNKPMFYVFETVRHRSTAWKTALDELRNTLPEPVLIIAQTSDLRLVEEGGFDGGYPYDGLAPFKQPRFLSGWATTAKEFASAGKLFIPSVGPGYWDDRAVPRGGADEPEAARTRDGGKATTYDAAWQAAIDTRAPFVTITSFNEWHEGSQIEPAIAKGIDGYRYPPYAGGETEYLTRTADWAQRFVTNLGATTQPRSQP